MKNSIKYGLAAVLGGLLVMACEKVEKTPDPHWNKVWEYTPAPGQFINMGSTENIRTPEEACKAAEKILSEDGWTLSLGGFGGYVTVGFDHDVLNSGSWDLAIEGNAFKGSSEPGIVWVMQDENGNGRPDDRWYELKGSEYGKPETLQDYSVTYYRPEGARQPVRWTDSEGQEGQIDHMGQFHLQDSYYPAWIREDSYTLTGTCLKSRSVLEDGKVVNGAFGWGYADNFAEGSSSENSRTPFEDPRTPFEDPRTPFEDPRTVTGDLLGTWRTNHFRISDAVKADGSPADLPYINFVKIQTGVNDKGPLVGEVSTEIIDIQDYHLMKR